MPITPLHMLPAWAAKEAAPEARWSLTAFCLTQVAIDVEPLMGWLLRGDPQHAIYHTWIGAVLCGLMVAIVLSMRRHPPLPALVGAMIGAVTHVALDAVMHADVAASGAGRLYGLVSLDALHRGLFASGALAALLAIVRARKMQTNDNLVQ